MAWISTTPWLCSHRQLVMTTPQRIPAHPSRNYMLGLSVSHTLKVTPEMVDVVLHILYVLGSVLFPHIFRPDSRSQWPGGLWRKSAVARLLGLWVRIPAGASMSSSCECLVLSGRGLCDRLITRPEESYWLWYVFVCDLENSCMRRPWQALAAAPNNKHSS